MKSRRRVPEEQAEIDKGTKRNMWKLILRNRAIRGEESHSKLEIVNKNGMTFLSPVAEKKVLQITGCTC